MVINNFSQSKEDYHRIEEIISIEDNIDQKVILIKELLKCLFKIGVLKLNKKKSTIEEIDSIRKDVGLTPILMIQSKLTSVFNNLFKGKEVLNQTTF